MHSFFDFVVENSFFLANDMFGSSVVYLICGALLMEIIDIKDFTILVFIFGNGDISMARLIELFLSCLYIDIDILKYY